MGDNVLYVKMVSGEEIVAVAHRKGKDTLVLQEPMTIEYGEQDGRRLIFMTRYNPFLAERTIVLDRRNVAYFGRVSPEVADYYASSLSYCHEVMDQSFRKGIRSATQYQNEMIEEDKQQAMSESTETWYGANTTLH